MVAEARAQVILDVRSRAEYDGDCFWPSGAVRGRPAAPATFPAACTSLIEKLRDRGRPLQSTSDEMRHGPARPRCHCPTGGSSRTARSATGRARRGYALSRLLGHPDAAVYYGSRAEWGTLQLRRWRSASRSHDELGVV